MEFFKKLKQSQRGNERAVVIFYSIYAFNIMIATRNKQWPGWTTAMILLAIMLCWGVFISKKWSYTVRAVVLSIIIQLTFVMYTCIDQSLMTGICKYIILFILVASFGVPQAILISVIAGCFTIFYCSVIDPHMAVTPAEVFKYACSLGDVLLIQLIIYYWMKTRTENISQMHEVIGALSEAEESKDDFLANISHEIRTPINTICGMSEMAISEQDEDIRREQLYDIHTSGRKLMSLVNDILDFSQLESGQIELEEEHYNISSTINDVINMTMAKKQGKDIELIVDCDASLPSDLIGDEKKIRRVLLNLLDNAIKYTNDGCVTLVIEGRREDYGINLSITVRDTGIGMDEADLEKLFVSFSQVDTKRNRQSGGIGLGLAISKALVQKMGGTITFHSTFGKGTSVRFVVPQQIGDEKPIAQLRSKEDLNIAVYMDMERFALAAIRDEYYANIHHMVEQYHVKCRICRNFGELKRRHIKNPFTHIFIGMTEYEQNKDYYYQLAKEIKVVLVVEQTDNIYDIPSEFLVLYKPFYILPVTSILNGRSERTGGASITHYSRFIAPEVKILVVDDNRLNIRVIEGLLKQYQIRIVPALSGHEALEKIESRDYDFVFMDHMMPEMDGVETFHRIREKSGNYFSTVPIIMLTANAAPGKREEFLNEGFADFVAKPIEMSVLDRVLRRNISEQKIKPVTMHKGIENLPMNALQMGVSLTMEQESGQRPVSSSEHNGNMISEQTQTPELSRDDRQQGTEDIAQMSIEELQSKPVKEPQSEPAKESQSVSANESEQGNKLQIANLNVEMGCSFCGGESSFLEILRAVCEEAEKKYVEYQDSYAKQDWKNYVIQVHGLKSTMKSIGAEELSEHAKELEFAGKAEEYDTILAKHDALMAEYRTTIEQISASREVFAQDTPVYNWGGTDIAQDQEQCDLPEISKEDFSDLSKQIQEVMYDFDPEPMLRIIEELEQYQFHGTALSKELMSVRKKIEKEDFISAGESVENIYQKLEKGGE